MNTPECYGFHFYAFLVIVFALFFGALHNGAYAAQRPTLVALYTMDNCGPCEYVKKVLVGKGVDVSVDYITTEPMVQSFPTCVYSDGRSDHGVRVMLRQIDWPTTLTVIHYKDR